MNENSLEIMEKKFFFPPNVNSFISYYKIHTQCFKKKRIYKKCKANHTIFPFRDHQSVFVFSPSRLEVYIYYQLLLFPNTGYIYTNHTCCSPTLLPHLMINIILIIKLTCNPKIKVTEQSSTGTVPDTVEP